MCLSVCLLLQKAGFLYIEQAFAEAETVFRRRVVLAVSCVNMYMQVHIMIHVYGPHSTYIIIHAYYMHYAHILTA